MHKWLPKLVAKILATNFGFVPDCLGWAMANVMSHRTWCPEIFKVCVPTGLHWHLSYWSKADTLPYLPYANTQVQGLFFFRKKCISSRTPGRNGKIFSSRGSRRNCQPFSSYHLIITVNWRKTSSISRTKSHNLNVSNLVLQLSLFNSLKPGVKSRMKM